MCSGPDPPTGRAAQNAHDFCRALVNPLTGLRKKLLLSDDQLDALTVPVHLLWGSEDNFLEPDLALSRFDGVSAVSTEVIEGAGHLMTLEVPDVVAASSRAFFAS